MLTLAYLWLPYMILPVYAGLERLPDSLLDASGDLGARHLPTFRSVVCRWPSRPWSAGSIFTFSLTPRRLHHGARSSAAPAQLIGNVVYANIGAANNLPFAAAVATLPVGGHGDLPPRRAAHRRIGEPVILSRASARIAAAPGRWCLGLAVIYIPLMMVVANSFNSDRDVRLAADRT